MLTPVDNPTRLRAGRDRRATATSSASSRSRARTRSPATRSTPASTCSSPTPSTASRRTPPWSIERSFFPSLIERGETFVAYVYDGYWIDIGTPEKYLQVHRDIMDGRYSAPPFDGRRRRRWVSPDARVEDGVELARPVLHRRGRRRQGRRARSCPYSVIGRQSHVEEGAVDRRRRSSGPTAGSAGRPSCADSILGRNCHIGRNAVVETPSVLGDKTVITDYSRLMTTMHQHVNLQGLRRPRALPAGSQRGRGAARSAAASSPISSAKRIAVSRDMRLSSPSLAAAFIDGARAQGADVVDYGMMATDMLYFAVARDGHDGGAQITASHNPEAVQRHQDGAARGVSAERRRGHRRHPRHDRRRHAAAAGRARAGSVTHAGRRSTTTSST